MNTSGNGNGNEQDHDEGSQRAAGHAAGRDFSHLVVIGASAGGIETLGVLVASLPADFGAPIIVAQHLSTGRTSVLDDILARRATLPVRSVEDREPLRPGVIYVVPSNRNVTISDHEIRLYRDGARPHPSIDLLFKTAAEAFGENVIAVVLTGTGSDGSVGARDVKYAGGTVIIQNPETAAYPGMPLSLAPSVVDIVADRERIATILHQLVSGTYALPPPDQDAMLGSLLDEIREAGGIDFSTYKQGTIRRRLQRRMVATGQATVPDYVRYVRRHPEEWQRLVNSFLIKVTSFFRDPDLFTFLRDQVLPELIEGAAARGSELRLWSAGCATGEEAYTLAIVVSEVLARTGVRVPARIFATDLDSDAIAFARRGVYPSRALADVPPEYLQRYFEAHDDEYEARKSIRSLLVFGEHDLAQRAPFPRIDLILCRNVLIYFTPALQRRSLQLFAFSLRPGGYLALGKSETVNPLAEYFITDHPRLKLYRRIGERVLIPPARMRATATGAQPARPERPDPTHVADKGDAAERPERRQRSTAREESILLALPFGVVVIDRHYDIVSINGEARRLFGIHSTALDEDLIHQIRQFDPLAVRRAIDEAVATRQPVAVLLNGASENGNSGQVVEIHCSLLEQGDNPEAARTVLSVMDVSEREDLRRDEEQAEQRSQQLTTANTDLLRANDELSGRIARLRVENEELLVASEEVQAATEEVETLNEELQASNEELETLNEELQSTIEELNTTNDDLEARTMDLQSIIVTQDRADVGLQQVVEALDEAVAVVGAGGETPIRNAAFAGVFGTAEAPAPLRGRNGELLAADRHPLRRAARGAPFTDMVATIDESGQPPRWYRLRCTPIAGTAERLTLVVAHEVTAPQS